MANPNDYIVLKLTIDNKDYEAKIDVSKGSLLDLVKLIDPFEQKFEAAYKQITDELSKYNSANEASIQTLTKWLSQQNLSLDVIEKTIQRLQLETKEISANDAAWVKQMAAVQNLTSAHGMLVSNYDNLDKTQRKMVPGQQQMSMAMNQFGYVLNDASMFMLNFRMGLMGVANNIPMIVQMFNDARRAAATTSTTVSQQLTAALAGGGGLIIAINALMLVMQLLPALFDDTTKAAEKQSETIKKLKTDYKNLTEEQIKNYLVELDKQLQKLENKYPVKKPIGDASLVIGGLGPSQPVMKDQTIESRFGKEADTYKDLETRKKVLQETLRDLGAIENVNNRISLHQEQLNKLNEKEESPFYYKNIVKSAKSLEDAQNIMRGWIKQEQESIEQKKKNMREVNQLEEERRRILSTIIKEEEKEKSKEWASSATKTELEDELILKLAELAKNENQIRFARNKEALQRLNEYRTILKNDVDAINEALGLLEKGEAEAFESALKNRKKRFEDQKKWEEEKEKFERESSYATESDPFEKRRKELDAEEALSVERATLYGATEEQITNIHNWYANQRAQIDLQQQQANLSNWSRTLSQLAGLFSRHTAAYKLIASAQVMIETYKAVAALYAPPPIGVGPVLAPFATGVVIATGVANVANIMKQPTEMKGFATGGLLPAGKAGFFEGTHNEIVAPEKDFISVVNEMVLKSQIAASNGFVGGSNSEFLNEIKQLNRNFEKYAERPARAIISQDEFNKGFDDAEFGLRKSH